MKQLFTVIALVLLVSCSKQAKETLRPETESKKAKGSSLSIEATTASIGLVNNGGGSFSIDYGGATDVVWMFFRGGDTLSTSGNVIPQNSLSFYQNPVTTVNSTFTRQHYQVVVVTGSTLPDANGVVGADWIVSYSNVVEN